MAQNLEQRMQQGMQQTGQQRPKTLADQIRSMEDQFQLAMPRGAEAQQLVRDALTCLRQTPALAKCTPASVMGGLMTCAQLGLRPGVLGHAYLIPFKNKGVDEAQLVIGYQGLVELAHRSGQIKSLMAYTVYENDYFEVEYGLEDKLIHKPCMSGDKGDPVAYYAVAKFNNGGHAFYFMSHDEMLEYKRKNVKLGKFGPWVDHFESMAHKTCVRQLAKWMPKSTDLARGIEQDGAIRDDINPVSIDYAHHPDSLDGEVVEQSEIEQPQQ